MNLDNQDTTPRIKPLSNRVLVRQLAEERAQMKGGLYLPDTAKEAPLRGVIVACGEGVLNNDNQLIKMGVSVGQIVYYEKFGGQTLVIGGEEFRIFREAELLAVEI